MKGDSIELIDSLFYWRDAGESVLSVRFVLTFALTIICPNNRVSRLHQNQSISWLALMPSSLSKGG